MSLEKYQIRQVCKMHNNAGSKANNDCTTILHKLGYQYNDINMYSKTNNILGKIGRQVIYFKEWVRTIFNIKGKSLLIVQHPCHYREFGRNRVLMFLKKVKKVKFISIVHDVEELRKILYNKLYQTEFENMLQIADVLIVHNNNMKRFFLDKGIDDEKIVVLEIFDYLVDKKIIAKKNFSRSLVIAGNLDQRKSPYIKYLSEIKKIGVKLYGPNYSEEFNNANNIEYCGNLSPELLPASLNEGFGVVWDGTSIDTCEGDTGEYLRYNNPHKLSLYLSSGLPVIIWKEAAEASFVQKHDVGICVSSLKEAEQKILEMDEDRYSTLVSNVAKISDKLREGHFMKTAIEKAERILTED